MVLVMIGIFGVMRVSVATLDQEYLQALIVAPMTAVAIGACFILQRLIRSGRQALIMPLFLFVVYVTSSFFMQSFTYYFTMCAVIAAIGALYLNTKGLGIYLIISNAVSLVLSLLNFPLSSPGYVAGIHEIVVKWALLVFSSILIYKLTKFATDKNESVYKAQDTFNTLFTLIPGQIALTGEDGRIEHISKPFVELSDLNSGEEAIGRDLRDLFADPEVGRSFDRILGEYEHDIASNTLLIKGKQYLLKSFKDEQANTVRGTFVEVVNVTPLMEAKTFAEEASKAKSAFLTRVSHEMRTPLNAVLGFSKLGLDSGEMSPAVRENIEKAYSSGKALLTITNNLLDIAKIESGKFELSPVEYSVPDVIGGCITLNINRIEEKPVAFRVVIDENLPTRLFGDELRVQEIFNNLLSNALKYTKEGFVEWKISFERDQGDFWIVSEVSDTGIGLRPEDRQKLFSDFCQADFLSNRKIEGTGLGLSITQKLANLMGGSVEVESEYGRGSTFSVRIRQEDINAPGIGADAAKSLSELRYFAEDSNEEHALERPQLPAARVLIVDDVPNNLIVAKGLMSPYGMKIDCVTSGFDAVELIRDKKIQYNAIFMDQMMPGLDGVETMRIIHEDIGTDYARNVPVIAMTANAIAGNEQQLLEKGFQAFIPKPIDVNTLDKVICTWIRDKALEADFKTWWGEDRCDGQEGSNRCSGEERRSAESLSGQDRRQDTERRLDAANHEGMWKQIDGFCYMNGLQRFGGDEELFTKVLRSFIAGTPQLIETLAEVGSESMGDEAERIKKFKITVHGLKSSLRNIAAVPLSNVAEELELAAKVGDVRFISEHYAPFIQGVQVLIDRLTGAFKDASESAKEKICKAELDQNVLGELLLASRDFDIDGVESTLKELEAYDYVKEEDASLLVWLGAQVHSMGFKAITARLQTVLD
jgi:signal transduction histidine kinase/CheY-like chemotaxis protein